MMRKTSQWIGLLLITTFLAMMPAGCSTINNTPMPAVYSSSTEGFESVNPDYALAEATIISGQSDMDDVSHQATIVSLDMEQAAIAAAQTTLDYNQRQLMELSIKGTQISQNMEQAAATQKFIVERTQVAWNTTATAQSEAATAAFSAYILAVTQNAQARINADIQSTRAAREYATQTAYSLTATPEAAIQADIREARDKAGREAWWDEYVITPLLFILIIAIVILVLVGSVLAYRRLIPVLELRLRSLSRNTDKSTLLVDGIINVTDEIPHQQKEQESYLVNNPQYQNDVPPQIEIIDPSEPSITNWIDEAEKELRTFRRNNP